MIDKRQISKCKYLYYVYVQRDTYEAILHVEKHPVIYMNQMYTYVKMARKSELVKMETYRIKERFSVEDAADMLSAPWGNGQYAFVCDETLLEHIDEIKRLSAERSRASLIERTEKDLARYEYEAKLAREKLEKLKK